MFAFESGLRVWRVSRSCLGVWRLSLEVSWGCDFFAPKVSYRCDVELQKCRESDVIVSKSCLKLCLMPIEVP